MLDFVTELEIANNAYRTEDYIVTQELMFVKCDYHGSYIDSRDVYYERTIERDVMFDKVFEKRCNVNGQRIPTQKHTRHYIK